MDPSTGTFTTMDTYPGKLSDPMSLHKYLFANSNPVKYCDPSGHFSMVEMDTAMAIDRILDAGFISGFLYCVDANETDPEHQNHSIGGYFISILLGMVFTAAAIVLSTTIVGILLLAVVSVILGAVGVVNGVINIADGHVGYGLLQIALGLVAIVFGASTLHEYYEYTHVPSGTPSTHPDTPLSFDEALAQLDQSGLRPGQTEISRSRVYEIVQNYSSTQAQSSVYTSYDGTRFLVEGHHTTVAVTMLGRGTGPYMGTPTTASPSATNVYWISRFGHRGIKVVP